MLNTNNRDILQKLYFCSKQLRKTRELIAREMKNKES